MNTPNHTPLPWVAEEGFVYAGNLRIADCFCDDQPDLPPETEEANAAYIVTACNAYPELVRERDALLQAARDAAAKDAVDKALAAASHHELVEKLTTLADLCEERGLYPLNVADARTALSKLPQP